MEITYLLIDKGIEKVWYIYLIDYYLAIKKEWNLTICKNIDGARGYYAKGNVRHGKINTIPFHLYMESLKK